MRFNEHRARVFAVLFTALLLSGAAAWAGSVSGTVKFEGKVPTMRAVKMDADPGCAKKHSTPMLSEMLVLGEGNTIGNIFVRISKGVPKKEYPAPKQAVVLDQKGCHYEPHVMGIMVGQPLKILNSDGLLHNVHALPKINSPFNQAMPASVTETVKTFSKEEGIFKIKCDVHPWMSAYISVLSHPFFDVTGKDGKFKIDNLPAGTYAIEAWHEKLPAKTSTITIGGDEAKTVDFSFSAPSRS